MKTSFLLLWLEAPLQAWGDRSKFGRRDTLEFPTKSGIAGLLLSALGFTGEQREFLDTLGPLRQTIVSYQAAEDQSVLLRDFHMVGSGYDDGDFWDTLHIPKKLDGSKPVGAGTKMTYRYYLQNAKFAVIAEVPDAMKDKLSEALANPVFDIYLGRKNCIPTDFIYRGFFGEEKAAFQRAREIAEKKNGLTEAFRVVPEDVPGGTIIFLNDVPVQFGTIKKYRDRKVTIMKV